MAQFREPPIENKGLIGILTMPFLHGDFQHLWGNTVSFFSLNAMLVYFYRDLGLKVLAWSWIGTGVLLWLSGAPGNHIGLSGVVYAQVAFLFLSGILRRHPRLIRVAMVVVFLYGSIVWGIFPIEEGVSWEGHLSGASMGGFLAWIWRKQGPQRPHCLRTIQKPNPWPPDECKSCRLHGHRSNSERCCTRNSGRIAHRRHLAHGQPALSGRRMAGLATPETDVARPTSRPAEHAKSRRGGIRKPRQGGHIKSKTDADQALSITGMTSMRMSSPVASPSC